MIILCCQEAGSKGPALFNIRIQCHVLTVIGTAGQWRMLAAVLCRDIQIWQCTIGSDVSIPVFSNVFKLILTWNGSARTPARRLQRAYRMSHSTQRTVGRYESGTCSMNVVSSMLSKRLRTWWATTYSAFSVCLLLQQVNMKHVISSMLSKTLRTSPFVQRRFLANLSGFCRHKVWSYSNVQEPACSLCCFKKIQCIAQGLMLVSFGCQP